MPNNSLCIFFILVKLKIENIYKSFKQIFCTVYKPTWLYKSGVSSIRSVLRNEKDSPCLYSQQVGNTGFPLYRERRCLLLLHFILATIGLYLLFAKWIKRYALGVTCWSSWVMNIPLIPLHYPRNLFIWRVSFQGMLWSLASYLISGHHKNIIFCFQVEFFFSFLLTTPIVCCEEEKWCSEKTTINLFFSFIE